MAGCSFRSARASMPKRCAWKSPTSWRCCSIRWRRPNSCTPSAPAMSTGSMFVLAISAYYLLRKRHVELAKRSMTVAASFGLASALCVVVLGDESGYTAGLNQKMKIAAIEAMWNTEPAPASFTVFGIPDVKTRTTQYEVKVPWVLGLIATRSSDKAGAGHQRSCRSRQAAHQERPDRLWRARQTQSRSDKHGLARGTRHPCRRSRLCAAARSASAPTSQNATPDQIDAAANSTIPNVPVLFWSFRFMVGLGFWFIALFALAFWLSATRKLDRSRLFLWVALLVPAAALDRGGTRLDRRRIWPPALGDRGRAADGAGRVLDGAGQCAVQPAWLRRLLFSASGRRSLSAGEIHPARSGRNARPCRCGAVRPRCGGVTHDGLRNYCGSSGGRCSAFC